MDTLEKNRLIAIFMGLAYCTKYQYEGWYKNAEFNHRVCDNEGLRYHSSWDWLVPAVEKAEGMGVSVLIGRFFCEIKYQDPLNNKLKFEVRIASGIKLNAVHEALLQFIIWYNENKTQ